MSKSAPIVDPQVARQKREALGLSQVRLAVRTGLSLGTVGAFERTGHATPRTLRRLAKALGVDAAQLTRAS
jgi:transcriptional regulator with XRE-family HTH domain